MMIAEPAYTFAQLLETGWRNERAIEKAREHFRFEQNDCFENTASLIEEEFKSEFEKLGVNIEEIRYSVSYSQGDGASWKGSVEVEKLLESENTESPFSDVMLNIRFDEYRNFVGFDIDNYVDYRIEYTDSYYCHEKTAQVLMEIAPTVGYLAKTPSEVEKRFLMLEEDLEDLRKEICVKLYKKLQEAYDAIYDDEFLQESKTLFLENGSVLRDEFE